MKNFIRKKISLLFIILSLFFSLSTCKQLTPGLGEKVDLDPPELSVESHSNGDYVQGIISLAGTAIDDLNVASVSVTYDDVAISAALEEESWTLDVDTQEFVDGDHEFRVTVIDDYGKESATSLFLIVDNSPPTVMITVPEYYGVDQEFNKSFTVKGEAADTTRVRSVSVSLYSEAGDAVFEGASATGTSSWYYTFNAEDLNLNGVYYFKIEAEDFSGNKNTFFYHFNDILNAASSTNLIPNIEEINGEDYQGTAIPSGALTVPLSSLRRDTEEENRVEVNFNPDSDMPEFIFISPGLVESPADPLEENVFASPQRLSGFIQDDDGVDFSTLTLRIMNHDDDSEVEPWSVIDPADISGTQWSYATNLADGNYYVQLSVDDIYGKSGTSTIAPFRVSSFAPVITINEPNQGRYIGSNSVFDVVVTVSALGTGTVELDPTGDEDWSDAVTLTESEGVYRVTMDGGDSGNFIPADGAVIFKLRAGITGNYGKTTLQLTGDIELPTVSIAVPADGDSINGALNFAGTAGDNNLIKSVYLWIEEGGSAATEPPSDITTWLTPDGTDLYNWFYYKDTNTLNSGLHYIHVKAFDAADNPSADFSGSFTVDQESDRPVISLSNMVIGGTGLENGLGRDASIIGLVEDDDGVDSASIEVRIDIYNDGIFDGVDLDSSGTIDLEPEYYDSSQLKNESEQWIHISNHPDNTTRIVSWSHSLFNIPQGTHSMQIRVHDTISDGTTHDKASNTNYNEIVDTLFVIDYGPPDLIITSPANGTVFNAGFTIVGNASDTNGVEDISISINGGAFTSMTDYDPDLAGDPLINWSYSFTVDAAGADDGDYTYQVQATDISGGKTTLDRQLVVDATNPTIEISQPASDGIAVNGDDVNVQGTASDNRAVDSVYYYIGDSVPADFAEWTVLTGTNTWNFTFDSMVLKNTAGAQDFTVHLKTLDKAGNISSDFQRVVSVDQTSDRPVISFNDIDKEQALAANNVLVGATTITGILEDDDLIDPALFSGAAIEISLDGAAWTNVSQPPAASGKFVVWKHDISGIGEGGHTVRVRARDKLWSGDMGTSSSDYAVSPFDTNFNWAVEDGVSGTGVPFILNLGPPAISIDQPANYTFHNTDVVIAGGVGDANGVASMAISTDNGASWIPSDDVAFTFTQLDSTSWTWSYTKTVAANGDDDRTYSYIISAEDTYGSVSVENGQFTVDATKPQVFVDLPVDGNTVNGSLSYTGRSSDNIQVVNVYYSLDSSLPPDPSTVDLTDPAGPYYDIGSTYAWTHPLTTTAVNDTAVDMDYYFTVVGVDGAGNLSDRKDIHVIINQETDKPGISFSSITAGGSYTDNLLPSSSQITGTVTDDDQVAVDTIKYMLYKSNGTTELLSDWTVISGPPGTDTSLAPWTHLLSQVMDVDDLDSDTNITELIPIPDGKYQMAVRAADTNYTGDFSTDSFQWRRTDNINLAIDTANPVTSFTTPVANGGYTNGNFIVAGTAADDGGIQNVDIQFGSDSVINLYNDPAAASPSVFWTTVLADSGIVILGHPDDGTLNYKVNITDAYGKLKTYERYITVDTQVPVIDNLSLVSNDADSPLEVNGSVLIQGIPSDAQTLVKAVYIKTSDAVITYPAAGFDPETLGWEKLTGTSSINYRFNSETLVGGPGYSTHLLIEDAAGNRSPDDSYIFNYTVDQTGNIPDIIWDTADSSILSTSQVLNGSIIDDDGIDASSIEIFIDGVSAVWEAVSQQGTNGPQISFVHNISDTPGLVERVAAYTLRVQASDLGENFTVDIQDVDPETAVSSELSLFIDNSDPVATVTQLDTGITTSATLTGAYINDQFTITGTADDGVQVKFVRAKLAGDSDFVLVSDTNTDGDSETPYDTWSWNRTGLSLAGDSISMALEVEDFHGKVTPYSYTLLVDSQDPSIGITTPSANTFTTSGKYNGIQTFQGTSTDNIQVTDVYYKLDSGAAPTTTDPVTDAWTKASGTYSWNFILDTVNDVDFGNDSESDSTIYLGVVSVDSAGNISGTATRSYTINQGSDRPVLTITQPTASQLLEGNAKVIASLTDDDLLVNWAIQVDEDNNGSWDTAYADSEEAVGGTNANIDYDLTGLSDGTHKIQLRARDNFYTDDGTTPYSFTESAEIVFDIDTTAPLISINEMTLQDRYGGANSVVTEDFNGTYINNDFILKLGASDPSGISLVQVSTNSGADWVDADDNGDGTFSITLVAPSANLSDGTRNIRYRAFDGHGKMTSAILTVIVDTTEPVIDFTNPTGVTLNDGDDAPNVNGDVLVRGSVIDSSSISSVGIVGGIDTVDNPILLSNTGNTIAWKTTIAGSGTYAEATYAIDKGSNIWRLPLKVTAEDFAGNITTTTGYLDLDPDSDKPEVSIVAPSGGSSVSGTFLVNGSITDDDGTSYVALNFDLDDDGFFDNNTDDLPVSNDLNGNALSDDTIDEFTPVLLTAPSGSWSIALNASDFSIINLSNAGYTNSTGFIGMRMTPYDINGLDGDGLTIRIYLDTNSPVISGLDIDGTTEIVEPTPATGTIQKGDITIRARFEDDKELIESGMLISFNGGAEFVPITAQTGYTITNEGSSPYKYYVSVPVNTTTAVPDGNGVLSVQISVTDQTNKQTTKSLQYNIDNDLPRVHWNENGSGTLQDLPFIGASPDEIYTYKGNATTLEADDAYKVLGAAIDSGTISGIEKVNVYFVKDGDFHSPVDSGTFPPLAVTPATETELSDEDGVTNTIPFMEDTDPLNPEYVITINNRIEQGLFDQTDDIGDKDGFQESLKSKAGYDEWYAYFDTTELPDGPLEIYSVVYDEAGNMSYTVIDAQIANNPPTIPTIVVGSTTIDDSYNMAKASGEIVFTINTLDVEDIEISTITMDIVARYVVDSGLGDLDESFTPPAGYTYADFNTKPADNATSAQFIENFISDNGTPGVPGDDPLESGFYYEYLVQVNDDDGNLVTRTFYLWINNADNSAPTVNLNAFTQDSVSGGGGHLEEQDNSPNDVGDLDDPKDTDLSGTVTVSGTAYDDTQVTSITVEYSPDDGITWYDAGTAELSDGEGNDNDGYDYTWTYDWNTATIKDNTDTVVTALADVILRAYGTDGTNTTPETGAGSRPELRVDVVPYITGITGTGFDSGLLTYVRRSATGRYPVSTDTSIIIDGYNLPVGETNSVGFGAVPPGTLSGSGSSQQITVDLAGLTSAGDLFLTTNGVKSLNNDNNNGLPQNDEKDDSLYHEILTDDRGIILWDVSGIDDTGVVTDPVMSPNVGNTGYDWMYVRSGKDLHYLTDGTLAENDKKISGSNGLSGGPFTYNDSGSLIFLFNHNLKWSSYQDTFSFTGSVQFGQIASPATYAFTFKEDEAYNWNQNTNFGKLGLGNYNFNFIENDNTSGNPIAYPYTSVDLNRYENVKLISMGDNDETRNYVAYFDGGAGESRSIVFYAFKTSNTGLTAAANVYSNAVLATSADAGGGFSANIDKFSNAAAGDSLDLAGTHKNANLGIATPRGRQEVTTADSYADSSQFDLAVYEQTPGVVHYGFIAYFDETSQSLEIKANESLYTAEPRGALGTWISSEDAVDESAGADVSIAVDPLGGIHLAYKHVASGYLKYAKLTYNADTDTFTEVEKVFVDALLGAGSNNSIVIRDFGTGDYRPVIMTFSSAYNGTKAPMRLSYPLATPGSVDFGPGAYESTGEFTGKWETVSLPADSSPKDQENFLYLDAFGNPHIGYTASTLEEATFLGF